MKSWLFLLLFPYAGLAQDGEQLLNGTVRLLRQNGQQKPMLFVGSRRWQTQVDTSKDLRFRTLDYAFSQQYEQAVPLLERSAATNPKDNGQVGSIYLNFLHDYPRAIRHLDAYDALTPNFDDVYANNPVSYLRGIAYQKMGDHQKAIEQMSRGIDSIDLKHGSKWVNYRYFINRAVSYLATNQPEKALSDLDKAVENFTRSALAQYYRGRALLALNHRVEAKTAFQDAAFFLKALRVERGNYQEDDYNPVCEEEMHEALAELN